MLEPRHNAGARTLHAAEDICARHRGCGGEAEAAWQSVRNVDAAPTKLPTVRAGAADAIDELLGALGDRALAAGRIHGAIVVLYPELPCPVRLEAAECCSQLISGADAFDALEPTGTHATRNSAVGGQVEAACEFIHCGFEAMLAGSNIDADRLDVARRVRLNECDGSAGINERQGFRVERARMGARDAA